MQLADLAFRLVFGVVVIILMTFSFAVIVLGTLSKLWHWLAKHTGWR